MKRTKRGTESLLERSLAVPIERRSRSLEVSGDDLDAIQALAEGRITITQLSKARGTRTSGSRSWVGFTLFQALKQGLLKRA